MQVFDPASSPRPSYAAHTAYAAPELTVLTLEITYVAEVATRLPAYPTTTFRGALGRALRDLACTTLATTCNGCSRLHRCAYGTLWEYAVRTEDGKTLDVPKAYLVFSDDAQPRELRRDEALRFGLRLFGAGRGQVPLVVEALRRAGQTGFGRGAARARLIEVIGVGHRRRELLFDERHGQSPVAPPPPSRLAPFPTHELAGRVRLELLSPLALSPRHTLGEPPPRQVLDRFDPVRVTELLAKRFAELVVHHEMHDVGWDITQLVADAAHVRVVSDRTRLFTERHFSGAQERQIPLDGLTGTLEVDGVTPALAGLWRLAEAVHVGRHAVKGLGRFSMRPAP